MKVVAAFLSNTLFNFVIGLLLARYLGPDEYGLFALAMSAAVMVQTLGFDWARLAAARFYSERIRSNQPALRATLDIALLVLAVILVLAAAGLLLSGVTVTLSPGLAALALGVAIANGFFDYSAALLRARFRDDLYVWLITGKNVSSVLLTVAGAYWFGSARAALLGVILSLLGTVVILRSRFADPAAARTIPDRRLAGTLFRYALPIVLANVFYQSIPLVDRVLIARSFGLAESGQFSFAYDVGVRIVAAVGSMLDVLLFQIAVEADEIHGTEHGRRQIGRNMGIVFAVLMPACAGLWLVLPSFEALVVPSEFRGPFAFYLALLLPGLFCYGLIFFALHPLFQIEKKTAPLVVVAMGASLVNLIAVTSLPHAQGSFPGGQVLALSAGVVALVAWAGVLRPFWPAPRDLISALAATAVMLLAAGQCARWAEPGIALLLMQVSVGAAVYAGVVWATDLSGLRTIALAGHSHRPRTSISR